MTSHALGLANDVDGTRAVKSSSASDMFVGSVCMLLCLLFNPFLALFFLAVLSAFARVPTTAFFLSMPVSFTCFFFFREYGVEFMTDVTDDIPAYLLLYAENAEIGFGEIFTRFLQVPGSEPLWHIPWWVLQHGFGGSEQTFLFLHYAVVFFAIFISCVLLSKRYFVALALVYFFLTPLSIDSATYVWRQQLAFSMYLCGAALYLGQRRPWAKWLIFLSPLMHLSLLFFGAVFIAFELYRKYVGLENKVRFVVVVLVNLVVIALIAPFVFRFLLDVTGLSSNLESYLEGVEADRAAAFASIPPYCAMLIVAHLKLKSDDLNSFLAMVVFAVFAVVLAFPGATGVYLRLLLFAFPLLGVYFFRAYLLNFSLRWFAPLMVFVFSSGVIRMYRTALNGDGVVQFLAYGHAFDPTMGVVKMLLSF